MSFSMVNGIATIHLDAIGTLALALVLLLLGNYLRNHVSFLERFCIPAPVAGGFTFSFIHCILYMAGILCFEFDTAYQSPAMIAFFTCVGLATRRRVERTLLFTMYSAVYWLRYKAF